MNTFQNQYATIYQNQKKRRFITLTAQIIAGALLVIFLLAFLVNCIKEEAKFSERKRITAILVDGPGKQRAFAEYLANHPGRE